MNNNLSRKAKTHEVASLFDSIAHTYDFLNHILSGGFDYYWRKRALKLLGNPFPKSILDVACGTGDFSIAAISCGAEKVIGIDIAEKMLIIGKSKIDQKKLTQKITLETGNAESIKFPDSSFDAAIVAFGVRNFENLNRGLSEMHRVLKTNGKICVLEFSKPGTFPVKQIYSLYFRYILPMIGKVVSKSNFAYQYLPDTVMQFPEGKEFLNILKKTGFEETRQHRLTFGIVTVYIGIKH